MKQKLIHNLGLKVLALLCAIGLWVIAVNINDPVIQRIYTVPVRLENLNTLISAGKYVEMMDGDDVVRVTVRANRSLFPDFNEKNISATADVLKMTDDHKIPVELSPNKIDSKIESLKSDKDYISIAVEDVMKLQKQINVNVVNQPEEGYILGNISTDQNAVIVSGPKSVVSMIDSTGVEINVDGATSDVNITLPVHLYDEDGHTIVDSRLTKSINEVFTRATVLQKKKVPIVVEVKGEAAEGYLFTDVFEKSSETVLLAGKPSVLKNLSQILITEQIDIDGANTDVSQEYDIKKYLPESVILVNPQEDQMIRITAKIQNTVEKKIKFDESNLEITNVPDGYKASIKGLTEMVEGSFEGLKDELDGMNSFNLRGSIDLSNLFEGDEVETGIAGDYYLKPEFELPEHVKFKGDVKIHILLEEK